MTLSRGGREGRAVRGIQGEKKNLSWGEGDRSHRGGWKHTEKKKSECLLPSSQFCFNHTYSATVQRAASPGKRWNNVRLRQSQKLIHCFHDALRSVSCYQYSLHPFTVCWKTSLSIIVGNVQEQSGGGQSQDKKVSQVENSNLRSRMFRREHARCKTGGKKGDEEKKWKLQQKDESLLMCVYCKCVCVWSEWRSNSCDVVMRQMFYHIYLYVMFNRCFHGLIRMCCTRGTQMCLFVCVGGGVTRWYRVISNKRRGRYFSEGLLMSSLIMSLNTHTDTLTHTPCQLYTHRCIQAGAIKDGTTLMTADELASNETGSFF